MTKNNSNIVQEEMVLDRAVTMFKTYRDSYNPWVVSVDFVLERIRSGKRVDLIQQIRSAETKKEKNELKKQLPAICFSGKFKRRANNGLIQHSGLIAIDFDGLNERLFEIRQRMISDKYTYACFLSPGGNGLKIIVKIPPIPENHEKYFQGLKYYYNEPTLDELKDIGRICYESFDPNIYINKKSKIFDFMVEEEPKEEINQQEIINPITDFDAIYEKLKIWIHKSENYVDGNKYNFLMHLSSACNRFGIPKEITIQKLQHDYLNAASHVDPEDYVDIVTKVYISYVHQFSTAKFDKLGNPPEGMEINPNAPLKDIIYLNDIRDEMIRSYKYGDAKGTTTYFKTIDPHWSWKKGEVTLMGGIGNHGKTLMMLQLMLIKSIREGTKWGVFSPEQNPPTDFYKDLIHTYIGKPTDLDYKGIGTASNVRMTFEEYCIGMDFMMEHFYFIYPKDNSPTPHYINDMFEKLIVKHGIEGCLTDPFNQLDNDWGKHGRDDRYISDYLSAEKRFSLLHNIYKIIIAHPKSTLQKKNDGNYQCPDFYDLAGGAMWNNKCDNILCTYRPYYSTDKGDTSVQFRSQKIKKQKLIGIPGNVGLKFSRSSNRYLEYADPDIKEEDKSEKNGISPFDYRETSKSDSDAINSLLLQQAQYEESIENFIDE